MARSSLSLSVALAAFGTLALTASVQAQTKPGEIKGIDAMGDKDRSAQDGWSQAPVPREESAAKAARHYESTCHLPRFRQGWPRRLRGSPRPCP